MLPALDYLLLCCVDFENKISIYLSIYLLYEIIHKLLDK